MFIAWYGIVEPEHITGFPGDAETKTDLNTTLREVHRALELESQIHDDPEILYAFGLMAKMFWFVLSEPKFWEKISIEYRERYRELKPSGLDASIFADRGAYGAYYSSQVSIPNGY